MKRIFFLFGVLWLLGGCSAGDGDRSDSVASARHTETVGSIQEVPKQSPTSGETWDPSLGTATLKGFVHFSGKTPQRRRIDMGADQKCKALHTDALTDESVIVNSDGTLRNVFVWIKNGLAEGVKYPVPEEAVIIEQKGCVFIPHVQGVQVGQSLLIRNDDPLLHNVHSLAKRNKAFNLGQPRKGVESTYRFHHPEVMVKVKCDIHLWMSTYLGVLNHPYFAVTGGDGSFEIKNLPPGEYTVEAWHEVYGTKTASVTLGHGETLETEYTFER